MNSPDTIQSATSPVRELSPWHINRFLLPVSGTSQLVPKTGIGFWYQLAWHTRPVSATTSIYRIFYLAVGNI